MWVVPWNASAGTRSSNSTLRSSSLIGSDGRGAARTWFSIGQPSGASKPDLKGFGFVVPVRLALRIWTEKEMRTNGSPRRNSTRNNNRLDLDELSPISIDSPVRIRMGQGRPIAHEHTSGSGSFRAAWLNRQKYRFLTPRSNVRAGLIDPVIKWIWFVQAWTVLLDTAAPDVLVWVDSQSAVPGIHRLLEVISLAPA